MSKNRQYIDNPISKIFGKISKSKKTQKIFNKTFTYTALSLSTLLPYILIMFWRNKLEQY